MTDIEPEDEFVTEEELRALLDIWQPPEPSRSLDQRISSSYLREMNHAEVLKDSTRSTRIDNEVAAMKLCSTCHEEFADKFSFCPVDGTPLNAVVARVAASPEPDDALVSGITATSNNGGPAYFSTDSEVASKIISAPDYREVRAASTALAARGEYHLTIMNDSGLASRLAGELKDVAHQYELTWPEFKRDPIGFTKRSITGYGQMAGRFFGNRNVVVAMLAALFAMIALVVAVRLLEGAQSARSSRVAVIAFAVVAFAVLVTMFGTWLGRERGAPVMGAQASDSRSVAAAMVAAFVFIFLILGVLIFVDRLQRKHEALLADKAREDLQIQEMIDLPNQQPTPDAGTAGMAKGNGGGSKPKQEKAGGGGGGGREESKPASAGKLPQVDLRIPQVVAPDPHPPIIKNPALPVAATLDADPKLFPPDTRNLPYGDPKSKSTDASSGPGTGNGIGSGTGGGVGPGSGGGYGPGNGGNTGGGDRHEGGGGAGGGGGGGDYNRIFNGKDVTQKARVLSKPEPQYTEDARKNQVTGTVVLRAVFTSGGAVTQISAVRGLPNGLTEKAIAAARNIKFVPAMKDGHPVSQYMQLEYNFNLY